MMRPGKVIEISNPADWGTGAVGEHGPFSATSAPSPGHLNGRAAPGAWLVDVVNGRLYRNDGTIAATVWTLVSK